MNESYDAAAKWCARLGVDGRDGCYYPANIDCGTLRSILNNRGAFMQRVRHFVEAIRENSNPTVQKI